MKKKIVMVVLMSLMLSVVGCASVGGEVPKGNQEEVQESEANTQVQEEGADSEEDEAVAKEGYKEAGNEESDEVNSGNEKAASEMAIGKVTAIEGDTITVVLGEMNMGGDAPTGEKPAEGKAPTGEKPSEGEAPTGEKPAEGEAPSGERPTEGEAPSQIPFTASDESITITFDSSVAIWMMTDGEIAEGSVEAIAVDTMLSIAYDDAGVVTSIQIMGS